MFTLLKVIMGFVVYLSLLQPAKMVNIRQGINNFAFMSTGFMSNLYKTNHHYLPNGFDVNNIFKDGLHFDTTTLAFFNHQYQHNRVYHNWCNAIHLKEANVKQLTNIAFLPISFFKTHEVVTGSFEPEIIFTSSGTTQTINSRHLVQHESLYRNSFIKAFESMYGSIKDWCIIGLLPSYLERQGSSLVYMVDEMIRLSQHAASGFYLNEFDKLATVLQQNEAAAQQTLLIGVTFGLLDFAEAYDIPLQHTVVMETGGMKGRRQELTRQEVHEQLKTKLHVPYIHSEYGMTELLSQAYSKGEGRYICPPWMKVLVRDEEDPLNVQQYGRGILNIIDLANVNSCCFIATDDAGIVYEDGSFEVLGRVDNSDLRGCSLLVL